MATSRRSLCLLLAAALAVVGLTGSAVAAGRTAVTAAPLLLAQADPDAAPDDSQGASALLVRITRLEDQIRSMTGQIEQLQFQNKRLEDSLRKMQQDVDFRFQDLGRGGQPGAKPALQKRGDAADPSDADVTILAPAAADTTAAPPPPPAAKPARHAGDAFDPDADPDAPGAPKLLGTTAPSEPLPPRTVTPRPAAPAPIVTGSTQPHAPLELMPAGVTPPPPADAGVPRAAANNAPPLPAAIAPAGVASLTPAAREANMKRITTFTKAASTIPP